MQIDTRSPKAQGHHWSFVAGYDGILTPTLCVLTRMRLRHFWLMPIAYLYFRRISRACPIMAPGLLRYAFAVESPWTYHTISVWRDSTSVHSFGNIPEHVRAARWTFRNAEEIWSTEWSLSGISTRNSWDGRNMKDEILTSGREEGGKHG